MELSDCLRGQGLFTAVNEYMCMVSIYYMTSQNSNLYFQCCSSTLKDVLKAVACCRLLGQELFFWHPSFNVISSVKEKVPDR